MDITVVGGTGHVGRFLVPILILDGHRVTVITRGVTAQPSGDAWGRARVVSADIGDPATLAGIASERPEVVVDIPGTARQVFDAVCGAAAHVVAIGSVWMYGEPRVVPTPEAPQTACPFDGYARRYEDIQRMAGESGRGGTAFTAIMPPNICGPGKIPLDCLGGRDVEQHRAHAAGKEVVLPEGPDALVGPCDAEDIARCVHLAILHRENAAGQILNVGAAYALTWGEVVAAYGRIHGVAIPIRRVSWQEYEERISPGIGYWWHMRAHMCPDISKARRLLGYDPLYTAEATMERAVEWMRSEGLLA